MQHTPSPVEGRQVIRVAQGRGAGGAVLHGLLRLPTSLQVGVAGAAPVGPLDVPVEKLDDLPLGSYVAELVSADRSESVHLLVAGPLGCRSKTAELELKWAHADAPLPRGVVELSNQDDRAYYLREIAPVELRAYGGTPPPFWFGAAGAALPEAAPDEPVVGVAHLDLAPLVLAPGSNEEISLSLKLAVAEGDRLPDGTYTGRVQWPGSRTRLRIVVGTQE